MLSGPWHCAQPPTAVQCQSTKRKKHPFSNPCSDYTLQHECDYPHTIIWAAWMQMLAIGFGSSLSVFIQHCFPSTPRGIWTGCSGPSSWLLKVVLAIKNAPLFVICLCVVLDTRTTLFTMRKRMGFCAWIGLITIPVSEKGVTLPTWVIPWSCHQFSVQSLLLRKPQKQTFP